MCKIVELAKFMWAQEEKVNYGSKFFSYKWIITEEGENWRWRIYLDGPNGANKSGQIWTNLLWTDIRWTNSFKRTDCLTNEPIEDRSLVNEPRVDGPKSHVALN